MNNQPTNDEDQKQQSIATQHPARSELLRKIYYPDTLYPDGYTFFADRGLSRVRSPPMDINEQDSTRFTVNTATIPKQTTNDIEMMERQNKYTVSILSNKHQITKYYLE
jgi:hypothetical protein